MEEFYENDYSIEHHTKVDIDNYMNDDNSNKLDIIHIFGKEKLEKIQTSLSKATGLAFITVDYKGEPITESTYFSKFCFNIRKDASAVELCRSSDAFGAIQAAVTQKPNVYFCPCGLLEVAIPIVVKGHYLGGFIGGQIRCNDAPSSVSCLESVIHSKKSEKLLEDNRKLMEEIPEYSYEKFVDIANLVFLVINQLSENEISKHMQEEVLKKRIKKFQIANNRCRKENEQKDMQLNELKALSNPYEIINGLISILNMTIIENAPQTNEMMNLFIEYLKYMYMEKETFTTISNEIEHVNQYLKFHKKRLRERLDYSINIPKDLYIRKIPTALLMPFVQNALYNGIMLKKEGGKISLSGDIKDNNIVLIISDNGVGLTGKELDIKFESFKDKNERYYIKLGMECAMEKVKRLFGEDYNIVIEDYRNKGRKCILIWPENLNERIE